MSKIERARFKNPERAEGQLFTERELEVVRLHKEGISQTRITYTPLVYEYWAPFNYPNIKVELGRTDPYVGAEYNEDGVELDIPPYGAITIVEDEPIVGVTVIGSACVAPGFVLIQAEPIEWKYPRTGLKMKIDGLWGEHIRIEPWKRGINESWRNAGMSSAHFELPDSRKVTIMAGSEMDVGEIDANNMRHDAHYAVRVIRITVKHAIRLG